MTARTKATWPRANDVPRGTRRTSRGRRNEHDGLRLWLVLAVVIVIAIVAGRAGADSFDRVGYVTRSLAAVQQLGAAGRDKLELDLYTAARTSCRAGSATPSIECLVEAATKRCKGDATCAAAADIVATNMRATNDWLDEPTRVRILRTSTDYRAALAAELRKRNAVLAAELALGGRADGASIDRFCRDRDRSVHVCEVGDPSCVPSVPWSRCVAALVWFVGGAT
jgi:hypothetical protein